MPRCKAFSIFLVCVFSVVVRSSIAQSGYSSVFNRDPLAQLLRSQDVVVKGHLLNDADQARLVQLAKSQPAALPVRIAVVPYLPKDGSVFKTRDRYTHALHRWLGLGDGMLIVLTPHGVSLSTSALTGAQIDQVLRAHLQQLKSTPASGIVQIVSTVSGLEQPGAASNTVAGAGYAAGQQTDSASGGLGTVFVALLIIIVVAVLVNAVKGIRKRNFEHAAALHRVHLLHEDVVNSISYADNYLDLLPPSAEADAARSARASAAASDQQAMDVARSGTVQGLGRAEALLELARQAAAQCKSAIDRATGGTGVAVAVDGTDFKAIPGDNSNVPTVAVEDPQVASIPENERAACFFCSRPARVSDLTPVTIVLEGKRRKVLACSQDVQIVQRGSAPQIRSVAVNGNPIPWYRAPGYDPYRDYYGSPAYYTPISYSDGGFTSGFLLGSLLNTYDDPIPYPVFVDPTGGFTADPFLAGQMAAGMNGPDFQDTGGLDFNNQADINTQPGADFDFGNQDTGGVDFGNQDTGGVDFGNQDTGGVDFGDQDTGGMDFGDQDTGGMDFGDQDTGGMDFGDQDTGGSDW